MTDSFTSIRSSYRGLDAISSVEKPTSILLGVSQPAANALSDVGICTVFDLASSEVFSNAVDICLLADSGEGRFADTGKVPRDILREGHGKPIASLPLLPISVLSTHSTKAQLDALAKAIDIASIHELAAWPPYCIARDLLNRAYNPLATDVLDQEAPADLIPANGRYPTERVQYEVLLFDEFAGGQATAATLLGKDGALDVSKLLSGDGGYERPAIGGVLTFTQSWYTKALALGNLIHGVALAPGESTKIAMIDWARRVQTSASEAIQEAERLDADLSRSRAISEITRAVATETQQGQSAAQSFSQATQGGSSGGAAGFRDPEFSDPFQEGSKPFTGLPGVTTSGTSFGTSAGSTFATAWSTSSGQREVGAALSQNIVDRTHQAAHSARNRRASIVREVSQQESESISTRTLTNYNHMHALTVEYYEVVQLYRTVVELSKAERCLFVPMKLIDFREVALIDRYRAVLAGAALSPAVREALAYPTGTTRIKAPAVSTANLYNPPSASNASGASNPQAAISHYDLSISAGNRGTRGKVEVHLGLKDGSWRLLHLKAHQQDGGKEVLANDGYSESIPGGVAAVDPSQIERVKVNWFKADDLDAYWLFRAIRIRYKPATQPGMVELISRVNDPYLVEFGDGPGQVKEWIGTIKPSLADELSQNSWNARDIHEAYAATAGVARVLPDGRLVLPSDAVMFDVKFVSQDTGEKPGNLTIQKVDGTSVTLPYGPSGWDLANTRARIDDIAGMTISVSGVTGSGKVGHVSIVFSFKSADFRIVFPVRLQPNGASTVLYAATVPTDVLSHLQDNRLYYSQAVWRALDPATIGILLSGFTWPVGGNDKPLIELVDPAPAAIVANYLVLRMSGDDATEHATWLAKKKIVVGSRREDLVPVPSGGVFAEAVMGRFNAAEKLDITRFWNWQDSPILIQAPDIAAIQAGSRRDPDTTTPGQLSAPLLNIVNPPSLPDPQGMAAVLAAIQNGNMFRDMSGMAATIGLAQAGMAAAQQGATAAGQQAGQNAAVAAELGAKVAELAAKLVAEYFTGGASMAAGAGVEGLAGLAGGISGQGGKLNAARDADTRDAQRSGGAPGLNGSSAGTGGGAGAAGSSGGGEAIGPVGRREDAMLSTLGAGGGTPLGALLSLILGAAPAAGGAAKPKLTLGDKVPKMNESDVVGAIAGKVVRGTPQFAAFVKNTNGDIVFKDEEGTDADRMMTPRLRDKLDALAPLVTTEWPGKKLRVTEAWDESSEHNPKSTHYEGRAADITVSDLDGGKLGRLAQLAVDAGFDWVFYEDASHAHVSVTK